MLLTPRTYRLAQIPDRGAERPGAASNARRSSAAQGRAKMLLVHQIGVLKVGEVMRYTLTYTPSEDRILPIPSSLHVRVKNTSAIALRAAYLHGPYTLYVATYPSTFNPNRKVESPKTEGVPQFEPNLKAGGVWTAKLCVSEEIREDSEIAAARHGVEGERRSVTWVIEIASQIVFSASASVPYELLVGRDESSLGLSFSTADYPGAGQVQDHRQDRGHHTRRHSLQAKGVYSKAVKLEVDDTESLWNKPPFPGWDDEGKERGANRTYPDSGRVDALANDTGTGRTQGVRPKKRRVHLVVLTHGLHSNLGADMLFIKESIDAAAKQAREDVRARRSTWKKHQQQKGSSGRPRSDSSPQETESQYPSNCEQSSDGEDGEDEDELVVVRGFSGNAIRTERGIKYLGKRLAKYVLQMTFPDQPFLPIKRSTSRSLSMALTGQQPDGPQAGEPVHKGSTIHRDMHSKDLAYKITSISFISHSLGGLIQTYALAYIQKHSPHFFDNIRPINFVTLATPFLGLSNENPLYVKFALDFGLVGRTGQDLGLTWRPPTLARSGWDAVIGGLSTGQQSRKGRASLSKPLLRVLPAGPAHEVLKRFRNRTVYANVVNDGIVPLRTSCLLFLDWQGLGRVEKARRENGVVGTMAGWGWAELTGAASSSRGRSGVWVDGGDSDPSDEGSNTPTRKGLGETVPQPSERSSGDRDVAESLSPSSYQFLSARSNAHGDEVPGHRKSSDRTPSTGLGGFLKFFQPQQGKTHPKSSRAYRRGQTMPATTEPVSDGDACLIDRGEDRCKVAGSTASNKRHSTMTGGSATENEDNDLVPPKTTFFESAGDILNPPIPPTEFIIDPSRRPRTIFHDRIYRPQDIPPPPVKHRVATRGRDSTDTDTATVSTASSAHGNEDSYNMSAEEKIARAYHRDLSWRKVLVRLEPDAHNNMLVRRMFSNAYGWPVVKHLCDTHFADTYAARTRDEDEPGIERAKAIDEGVNAGGGEVDAGGQLPTGDEYSAAERPEGHDELHEMVPATGSRSNTRLQMPRARTADSARWSDTYLECTDDEDDDDADQTSPDEARGGLETGILGRLLGPLSSPPPSPPIGKASPKRASSSEVTAESSTVSPVRNPREPDLSSSSRTHQHEDEDARDSSPAAAAPVGITEDATHVGLRKPLVDTLKVAKRRGDGGAGGHAAGRGDSDGTEGIVKEVARLSHIN
ncbi:hypothetical protein GP486_006361 [Trichoglossum hirsutum]|uniref:DUF676 domain-containing protein n=1 Tax=Trichoglossum hirsutum TaxID=265104 RepID=A0A9P8L7G0_9PEZI|nr:hypothetical protein GP486_006361 [Trichoglossum hirsutum]